MNPASRAGGSAQGFAMERRVADLRRTELRPADAKHRFYACKRRTGAEAERSFLPPLKTGVLRRRLLGGRPVPVLFDQLHQPVECLLLRNVALDDRAALVEGDAARSGAHLAVVGVGHLAGTVDDAAHHADAEVFQVRRAGLDVGEGLLDVVERAPARRAGDVFGV